MANILKNDIISNIFFERINKTLKNIITKSNFKKKKIIIVFKNSISNIIF